MNLFGQDVSGLDVTAFVATARQLFPLAALAWLVALLRVRRAGFLLAGVLAANAYAWLVTNYPLQRLYALGPSSDRVGNLALCQVVAAGNPPLETLQVGQIHFEPFWGVLVGALSGFSPDRVLAIYPFLPLVMMLGFAVAVYFGLRPLEGGAGQDAREPWSGWERAFAAGFATLLCSSPLDVTGVYRVPWAMTFLLKPNHALGLVLFPLVLRAFASIRGWRGRLGVGLLLHLLGWAFVLHMAYVAAGLVLFALLGLLGRREGARRDLLDVAAVLGVNFLIVSPYLYMLLVGYPFLQPGPRMTIHVTSAHLLETTARPGVVFALAAWGLAVLWRRGDRLGRLWVSQVAAAYLIWTAYLGLSALQIARERDEIYHWQRFLTGVGAGIGAWDLVGRVAAWVTPRPGLAPAVRAAALAALALPWSLPYWWDPIRMDSYFSASVAPLPDAIREPTDFLRTRTAPGDVVAGDRDYARYVAALGGRRVLLADTFHMPRDYGRRTAFEERLVRGPSGEDLAAEARRYGVRYLVVTPGLLSRYPGVTLEGLEARRDLGRVHDWRSRREEFVTIFRLE